MKYQIEISTRFKRDYKLAQKRGYDMSLLKEVIDILACGKQLPQKYCDHFCLVIIMVTESVTYSLTGF